MQWIDSFTGEGKQGLSGIHPCHRRKMFTEKISGLFSHIWVFGFCPSQIQSSEKESPPFVCSKVYKSGYNNEEKKTHGPQST